MTSLLTHNLRTWFSSPQHQSPNLNAPLPPLPTSSFCTYLSTKAYKEYNTYHDALETIRANISTSPNISVSSRLDINRVLTRADFRFQVVLARSLFYIFDALSIRVSIEATTKTDCCPPNGKSLDWLQGMLKARLDFLGDGADLIESAKRLDRRGLEVLRGEVIAVLEEKGLAKLDAETVERLRKLRKRHDKELSRIFDENVDTEGAEPVVFKLEPWVDEDLSAKEVLDRFTEERIDAATQVEERKGKEEEDEFRKRREAERQALIDNEVSKVTVRWMVMFHVVVVGGFILYKNTRD